MTRRDALVLAGLIALAAGLFFFRLGTPGLFDADEPAYAQAAREMLRTGDWITPRFNGQLRFDKPALFYWLIALAYRTFGVGEFAVRFWPALAAVGLTALIAVVARRRFGAPADLWAGLAFATPLLTALLARAAVTDMLLTLFVSGAVLAATAALGASEARSGRLAALAWAATGLAVLVKGPVGLLIPALALAPALWLLRELPLGRRLVRWPGLLAFAVVAAPWYALVFAAQGQAFIQGFVLKHHVTRYVGVVSSHAGPVWFYLPVLLVGFFPWSAFLLRAGWHAWQPIARRRADAPADRLRVVAACWAASVVLFFSFAGTKLPSYIFPAFPALALLVGDELARAARGKTDGAPGWLARVPGWLLGVTGGLLGLAAAALPLVLERVRPAARGVLDGVTVPVALPAAVAACLLLGTLLAVRARGAARPAVLAGMMAVLLVIAEVGIAPQAYRIVQAPLRDFSETARRRLPPGSPLVVYGLNAPSIVFYSDRRVLSLGVEPASLAVLARLATEGHPIVVITRTSLAAPLAGAAGLRVETERGGYALLVGGPASGT